MKARLTCVVLIALFFIFQAPSLCLAQDQGQAAGSGGSGGFLDQLVGAVGTVLGEKIQDEFDRWLGTYEGRIDKVVLVDQTPDTIVLDVYYKGVKRTDGVSAKAEVLKGGQVLPGFTSTIGQISGKSGRARLTIRWERYEGPAQQGMFSDQIRLYLARDDHPDRKFGELLYDFPKQWGAGPQTSEEREQAQEESGMPQRQRPVFGIKPGQILLPVGVTGQSQGASSGVDSSGVEIKESYDLWANAASAIWRDNRGTEIKVNGQPQDGTGVKTLNSAWIKGGGSMEKVIAVTKGKNSTTITARFPKMVYKPGMRFTARLGIIQGNQASFEVKTIWPERSGYSRTVTIYSKRINATSAVPVDAAINGKNGEPFFLELTVDPGWLGNTAAIISPMIQVDNKQEQKPVTYYSFFDHAIDLAWQMGQVRYLPQAKLIDKTPYSNVIELEVSDKRHELRGSSPSLLLGENMRLKMMVGLMQGSKLTPPGGFVELLIFIESQDRQEIARNLLITLTKDRYFMPVNLDLSEFAGERVRILFKFQNCWFKKAKVGLINPVLTDKP